MDDTPCPWTPELRADGDIEIGVNHNDNTSGRLAFDSVSLKRYLELYRLGALDFQVRGQPRPVGTRPTPAEVEAVLKGQVKPQRPPSAREIAARSTLRAAVQATARLGLRVEPEPEYLEVTEARTSNLDLIREAAKKMRKPTKPTAPIPQPPARPDAAPQPEETAMTTAAEAPTNGAHEVETEYRRVVQSLRDSSKEPTAEAIAEALHLEVGIVRAYLEESPHILEVTVDEDAESSEEDSTGNEEAEGAAPGRRGLPADRFRSLMAVSRQKTGPRTNYLANFPPIQDTVRKYAALSEDDRLLLKEYISDGWGAQRNKRAEEAGVSRGKIVKRVQHLISEDLGVTEKKKHTKYLRRLFATYDKNPAKYAPVVGAEKEPTATTAPPATNGHAEVGPHTNGHGEATTLPMPVERQELPVPIPGLSVMPQAEGAPVRGVVMVIPPGVKKVTIEF